MQEYWKSDKIFFLEKYVIKVIDQQIFKNIENIKYELISNKNILMYFKHTPIFWNKVLLYFNRLRIDSANKNRFLWDYISYIDFITPELLNVNFWAWFDWIYGIITNDPNIENYVLDTKNNTVLIDIESFRKDRVIFQPLYLFIKYYLYNWDASWVNGLKVFIHILHQFNKNKEFKNIFDSYDPSVLIDIYIMILKQKPYNDCSKTLLFFKKYKKSCIVLLKNIEKNQKI